MPLTPSEIGEAASLVRERIGQEVPPYRYDVLATAVIAAGFEKLRNGDEQAWKTVISMITVPETTLFRVPEQFSFLRRAAEVAARQNRPYRVLSAGCSTGEEAWSAAAVLYTVYGRSGDWEVTGWDVDEEKLKTAAEGKLRKWSARNGLFDYARYFSIEGESVICDERLRTSVRFRKANLLAPPADGEQFDAIFFRNVAIYWDRGLAHRVAGNLSSRLRNGGLFFPGPSDPFDFSGAEWTRRFLSNALVYEKRPNAAGTPERKSARYALTKEQNPRPTAGAHSRRRPMAGGVGNPVSHSPAQSPPVDPLAAARRLADQGELESAFALLEPQLETGSSDAKLLAGTILLEMNRAEEAVRLIQACVFHQPARVDYRDWFAVALETLGHAEEAARERRNALKLKETQIA